MATSQESWGTFILAWELFLGKQGKAHGAGCWPGSLGVISRQYKDHFEIFVMAYFRNLHYPFFDIYKMIQFDFSLWSVPHNVDKILQP